MSPPTSPRTTRRGLVRPFVWLVVCVAVALRLSFVLTLPARALYWDEPTYQIIATAYLSALSGSPERTLTDAIRLGMYKGEVYTVTVASTAPAPA